MKYIKIFGLLAVAAAVLTTFAGTASATITSGGSAYTGEIVATSSNNAFDGTVDIKCGHASFAGSTTAGATTFALNSVTFTECGGDTYSVIQNGWLRIDSSGTVYWEGTELTSQLHRSVFGFPITTHCIYKTAANPGTDVGALTEGSTSIELAGTNIPQVSTDSACGENAQWTGTYTITKPGALTID